MVAEMGHSKLPIFEFHFWFGHIQNFFSKIVISNVQLATPISILCLIYNSYQFLYSVLKQLLTGISLSLRCHAYGDLEIKGQHAQIVLSHNSPHFDFLNVLFLKWRLPNFKWLICTNSTRIHMLTDVWWPCLPAAGSCHLFDHRLL